ncbi:MAG: hypothetical protein ACI4KG_09575 [Oscillospiraceae bacterium]
MIKGVNKRVVEITSTDHEYFEKAVLYVRADKSGTPENIINEEAREYIGKIVPIKKKSEVSLALKLSAAAVIVILLLALCLILFM